MINEFNADVDAYNAIRRSRELNSNKAGHKIDINTIDKKTEKDLIQTMV